ncbi:uncharacterized protein SCHCODRAFT_02145092 [Schizophyllum commune H4-8]|uniref:uncharacterized protein n=1 Tax=Schizophyllum commune (strain H4-8 / FGSC 9210) TaxID=578458 RepID=UPI00215F74D9|nr:uncharacterized protein SCHCODRAFT_02145092 [Schizophyllum commune H4-8]KAI5897596.1 hypothetical protein SCHCODRAFT_02145092 [Schizophyllum commune H4-8]
MSSAVAPGSASSSTTLWATASKEWVIPSKPKPGRKPKKETIQAKDGDNQVDDKGRRVQNRAAQRAFRERKQSQLAELQARLQAYEQGEIERNVALQNIAKRLKEENEALRQENIALKEKLSKYEDQQQQQPTASTSALPPENEKKRGRAASACTSRKKSKVDPPPAEPQVTSPYAPIASPPELVSSPESVDTPEDLRYSPPLTVDPPQTCYSSSSKPSTYAQAISEPAFDCGFCSEDTPCVCRIAFQQASEGLAAEAQKLSAPSLPTLIAFDDPDKSSILDNLPTYQPPVPLRRRAAAAPVNSIFAVAPVNSSASAEPMCSGDPSNCAACASDTFGKAFCEALVESSEAEPAPAARCADCPGDCDRMRGGGSSSYAPRTSYSGYSTAPDFPAPEPGTSTLPNTSHTIPTHEAWQQLKSHPNVAFEDLAMLADVVSRRSKCTGPRVVIEPAPGSITPERSSTPEPASAPISSTPVAPNRRTPIASNHSTMPLDRSPTPTAPPLKQEEDDRPMLVPQHVLKTCGRRGMREVEVTAVQEALRLLDAKFRL